MRDLGQTVGRLVDRISNKAIRRFGSKTEFVPTDTPVISFTFDDVPDTALSHGAAILEAHGARGTFYIAGGLSGRIEPDRRLISAEGCSELIRRGHEVGCHTFSHDKMRTLSTGALAHDLETNRTWLQAIGLDGGRSNFAYPYNAAWPPARSLLRQRYRTCRAGGDSVNRGPVDPLMLAGMEIRQPEDHARALTARIDALVRDPGWMIFFTHDIADKPTPYGCTPETFDRLVSHARQSGCTILPVAAAIQRFGW